MSSDKQSWSSNGKLLITGEYLVMEGALSLALPLKKGQTLSICKNHSNILRWQANMPNDTWFTAEYNLNTFNVINTDNIILAHKLADILFAAKELSDTFLKGGENGCDVVTSLDFNPEFGFGTSSTLISNIAYWADVNPYELLKKTFGGSGYDIACASASNPILYQKKDDNNIVVDVGFNPIFKDSLFFVYLGNKQNSADGISDFKKHGKFSLGDINRISDITKQLVDTTDFDLFKELIAEHELIMSKIIGLPTVSLLYFNDFKGAVKSLGAWGGDFVMLASDLPEIELKRYLVKKGFDTVFRYDELVFGGKELGAKNQESGTL